MGDVWFVLGSLVFGKRFGETSGERGKIYLFWKRGIFWRYRGGVEDIYEGNAYSARREGKAIYQAQEFSKSESICW